MTNMRMRGMILEQAPLESEVETAAEISASPDAGAAAAANPLGVIESENARPIEHEVPAVVECSPVTENPLPVAEAAVPSLDEAAVIAPTPVVEEPPIMEIQPERSRDVNFIDDEVVEAATPPVLPDIPLPVPTVVEFENVTLEAEPPLTFDTSFDQPIPEIRFDEPEAEGVTAVSGTPRAV